MVIRESNEHDIPSIVELLKLSLGETLMPKSEAFWKWKHIDNPFGKSPVLLAFENNQLIGVRAFMRWEWTINGKIVKTARAVDTVTHPLHQGKGIFKKLTLSLLEECKSLNVAFIFNTPNQFSKPGYIRMGWEQAGKLPVGLKIQRPFNLIASLLGKGSSWSRPDKESLASILGRTDEITLLIEEHKHLRPEILKTALSLDYLNWRYVAVQVANYFALVEGADRLNALVIGRIKTSRAGRELRITEYISNQSSNPAEVMSLILKKAESLKADYITLSGVSKPKASWTTLNWGPGVTVFNLDYEFYNELKEFKKWSPSLGDLELF